ncbi:MAG: acyl-CoA dehydrogenase [Flavobacteriales bacterium CG03_land_8_20_14_0_80_35_15]|nr:acyl-CoA dehydrogenase [Zetaproteobacteria bacterium]NDK17991.1 acyl-CoA dehydrogenase [Flavobacteriales bacterium]OIO10587.1 MAG: acyl-CoA dehydrogenase [Flavobacteriaceae bacterium CG1_02_35_72]PIR12486.1 MAG: acyl-CoA dehydrogenase [Flavobacteriales bacterium CG11_big_fil_rev_8_21_14_0_20_35_7]PIV19212.1 MAG: acyl-CoA dehydrogenase [Flavobacteriales bacterium CG03_land_8_20_14_0_80_35_15]PIX06714.1 MAG: acyl-CoA dehydrogenase [Flavobacteriales bacterium CG_4_8_14_3_um_filter_35_10]PJA05
MNLFLTPKLEVILPKIKALVEQQIIPLERDFLHQNFSKIKPKLDTIRQLVKKEGLWNPHLSTHHGGLGLSLAEFGQISELLGHSPYGHYCFNCNAPDIGNQELLLQNASDDLKNEFLKPLLQGAIRSCFSMTEPEFAGSNPTEMATTAVKEGDFYIINGHKWFTSSADGASFAVVMANTNPDAKNKYQRASMIVVPTNNKGFELVCNIPVMGESNDDYFSHGEVRYTNCKVPLKNLIGIEGAGFSLAQQRLGPGRIHHCMRWIGICERAFDLMCQQAVTRDLGNGIKLGQKQSIQNFIAESRAEINAARFMVLHTASKIDKEGAKAARIEISTIKFFVANVLQRVLDRAIQTHGALGITDYTVLAFWYRHERAARIYDGPDEVHKSALARQILKHYGLEIKEL